MTSARSLALVATWAAFAAGCGDNDRACGANTELVDGECIGTGGASQCTGGTVLDEASGGCVIDPAACQDGTVLVGNQCRDPSGGITADVIEGAEPNGFGVGGEASLTPAGQLVLKAIGAGPVVVKGNLTPQDDRDDDGQPEPDHDTYVFDAAGPTLLEVSVDGLGGAAGAFIALSDVAELAAWTRTGINTTGDTARRQLFLPAAGRYRIAIVDTRTITAGLAVGDADNAYYASLEAVAIPTAATVVLTNGDGSATGTLTSAETRFHSASVGAGTTQLTLSTEHPAMTAALVALIADQVAGHAEESKGLGGDVPAQLDLDVIEPAAVLLVVDPVINTPTAPVAYDLAVNAS